MDKRFIGGGVGNPDVIKDGSRVQEGFLHDYADMLSEIVLLDVIDIDSIDEYFSAAAQRVVNITCS